MMKILNDRQEMAKAVNFGKYPVLYFDLAEADEYGLKGCNVRIDAGKFSDGLPYYIEAELRVYRDRKRITTSSFGTFLSADFGYSDYKKMIDWANTPLIGPDQEVVIAFYDSDTKMAFKPIIVRTGSHVSRHCMTPLTFEDVDMTKWLIAAGVELKEEQ